MIRRNALVSGNLLFLFLLPFFEAPLDGAAGVAGVALLDVEGDAIAKEGALLHNLLPALSHLGNPGDGVDVGSASVDLLASGGRCTGGNDVCMHTRVECERLG